MKKKFLNFIFLILATFFYMNINVYARHEVDLGDLSDYYGTHNSCNSSTEDCKKEPEYRFYLKMYDLYYLYLSKYNVKLDLPLIMSTLFYNSDHLSEVFKMNLNDYERQVIVDNDWKPKETTSLDWDYDYESQSNYLVSNDSSLDMQVLAKNMVTKTTVQKCVKDGKVIKSESVKDSEENLSCDNGSTLEMGSSTYQLDLDKYDDFLLEYIEKKYYLGRSTPNPVVSNGPDYVADKYPTVTTKSKSSSSSSSGNKSNAQPLSSTGVETIDRLIQIGMAEEGNYGTKYKNWFHSGDVHWCAIFVSWLFDQVGGLDKYIVKTSGAGTVARCSSKEGSSANLGIECSKVVDLGLWYESEYTDSTTVPRAGDVVVFTWNGAGRYSGHDQYYSDHVGFVYKVDDDYIYTIEGNTGSNDNTISVVSLKSYDRKSGNINGYFRPYY